METSQMLKKIKILVGTHKGVFILFLFFNATSHISSLLMCQIELTDLQIYFKVD